MLRKADKNIWERQIEMGRNLDLMEIISKYEDKAQAAKELLSILEEKELYHILLPITDYLNQKGIHIRSCLNCNRWGYKQDILSEVGEQVEIVISVKGDNCSPRMLKIGGLVSASKCCRGWKIREKE